MEKLNLLEDIYLAFFKNDTEENKYIFIINIIKEQELSSIIEKKIEYEYFSSKRKVLEGKIASKKKEEYLLLLSKKYKYLKGLLQQYLVSFKRKNKQVCYWEEIELKDLLKKLKVSYQELENFIENYQGFNSKSKELLLMKIQFMKIDDVKLSQINLFFNFFNLDAKGSDSKICIFNQDGVLVGEFKITSKDIQFESECSFGKILGTIDFSSANDTLKISYKISKNEQKYTGSVVIFNVNNEVIIDNEFSYHDGTNSLSIDLFSKNKSFKIELGDNSSCETYQLLETQYGINFLNYFKKTLGETKESLYDKFIILKEISPFRLNVLCYDGMNIKEYQLDINSSKEVQKGRIMGELEPSIFLKLQKIRNFFQVGDISLLDNFLSVCTYDAKELEALFGFKKEDNNKKTLKITKKGLKDS